MATFPGDMSINSGFGLQEEPSDMYAEDRAKDQALEQEAEIAYYGRGFDQQDESQPTDPLLAVSELEQRVTDLEERLRSLALVVNVLIEQAHELVHDEGRIDGHRAILTSLVGKVATLENHVEYLRTGKEKE